VKIVCKTITKARGGYSSCFSSSAHFKSSSDESDPVETTAVSVQKRSKARVLGITTGRLGLLDYGFNPYPANVENMVSSY